MVTIGARKIGPGQPCFVIAEAGVNHNGDVALARALIDVAAIARADAVKFQTFDPAELASADAPKAEYQEQRDAAGSQREMLEKLVLPQSAYVELKAYAESKGLLFLSTPFEERSADFLDRLGLPAFKLPSGEVTNHPFLQHVARKGRPILMSTGMCELAEVRAALQAIREANPKAEVALFHCVSSYPASDADCNLRAIEELRREFQVPVGWSDHTLGIHISVAAVARGAELIEKHITTARTLPGPDHAASLEPGELTALVEAIRAVEAALGDGMKRPVEAERKIAAVARKSLHWKRGLAKGEQADAASFVALRPGTGISPARLREFIGRPVAREVRAGALVHETDLER